jgi:Protein kinase domain/SPOR domain
VAQVNGGRGDLSAGDSLGDFRILSQLGQGGMGVVYLARDERLDRRVALKVIVPNLAADPDFRERFIAEARSAAAIEHPNAVPVYSAGVADGDLYMAMRYVEGTDLRAVLAEQGALDPETAVRIVAEVSGALDAAHAAGFVHRDVKPANILLEGGGGSSYLTDFGLTKGSGGAGPLTGTGQWVGTIDYVAPEQIQAGVVDARTDVYALGCVLYEALAGSVPYSGNDMQKMWGHVNEPFPALGGAGPAAAERLGAVIERATAKEPDARFPSAGDLANAATAALGGVPVEAAEHSVATGAAATGLSQTVTGRRPPPAAGGQAPTVAGQASPGPRERATRQMATPSPGGGSSMRTAAIVGAAIIVAAGMLAAAVVISGNDSNPASTVGAKPARNGGENEPRDDSGELSPGLPANAEPCGASGTYVEERHPGEAYTSCAFAREVAAAYYAGGESSQIEAYSPKTELTYSMTCTGTNPVLCTDGDTARVYLLPTSARSGASATASVPPPPEEEAGEVEEAAPSSTGDLGDWPGGTAYSAMLGAFSSEWRARNYQDEALERGLEAGVLDSSEFSSLRPGYWVVFSGYFPESSEAAARAREARSMGYSDSYPRLVSP